MSVCLFAMHLKTVRPNAMKLSRNGVYTQGKVDIYFVPKKNKSYACYRQSMKLTNRIAAFEKMQIAGSEGGRRPSERSDTILQMFYLSVATLCLLQAAYRTDQ